MDLLIKLESLKVGDVFNVTCPKGANWLFLTLSTPAGRIVARNITSQKTYVFCKDTGLIENAADGESECIISSVAPIPTDVLQVLTGLDARHGIGGNSECCKLTKREIEVFLFLDQHHKDNPL
jgi:hypothetical protein